ncbi:MAG: Holliday junction resolvase RuvX [Bacteroidales bacterium]
MAVTDPLGLIANALTTVPSISLLSFIENYMQKEEVDCIVVGEPKQMDASPSESSRFIEPFVKKLRKTYPKLKVERVDERFTSKIAFQTMIDAGLKKKQRGDKALIDAISATLILQMYMQKLEK